MKKRDPSGYNAFIENSEIRHNRNLANEEEQNKIIKNNLTSNYTKKVVSENIKDLINSNKAKAEYSMYLKSEYIDKQIKRLDKDIKDNKQVEIKSKARVVKLKT